MFDCFCWWVASCFAVDFVVVVLVVWLLCYKWLGCCVLGGCVRVLLVGFFLGFLVGSVVVCFVAVLIVLLGCVYGGLIVLIVL